METGILRGIARESIGWSIALSVLLILTGLVALCAPLLAGVTVTVFVAWLIVIGGFMHLGMAWHVPGAGAKVWEILVGVAYLVAGGLILTHPLAGLVWLTIVLALYLLFKGLFELALGGMLRALPGSGLLFVDAILAIVLSAMIWWHLPSTAGWVVGTLIGFGILFSGISRLTLSLAAKKVLG